MFRPYFPALCSQGRPPAEADKHSPAVAHTGLRIAYRGDPEEEAIRQGLDKLYQPLAEKYGLDIGTVLMFRDHATDWINTVVDGEYDAGVFYDGMMEMAHSDGQFDEEEVEEAAAYATAIAKADLNGLFYEILMMMVEDRDWPTDTKKTPIAGRH
jgi:hypothetical protein